MSEDHSEGEAELSEDHSEGEAASMSVGRPDKPVVTSGLIVVDKPGGMTSHDVVGRVRRLAHTRRVGHAGTLDPMATGVLVIGVEKATRLLHHLVLTDKSYDATIRLGEQTVTDDAEGDLIEARDAGAITPEQVQAALGPLTGDIEQVPSAVSAIKVDGQRSYQRVRDGEVVALPSRPVTVSRFDALAFARPTAQLLDVDVTVDCSSGTYIRALARDLGAALGVGGHLTRLRRTRVGPFTLAQAHTLEELAEWADPVALPLPAAVRAAMPVRLIDSAEQAELTHGRPIAAVGHPVVHAAVVDTDGAEVVVALLSDDGPVARPVLVFTPAG
jgi:tRNA pseudouridine55 synthase